MAFQSPDQPDEEFRRDRHEHGGMPEKLDDDRLAHEAEEERVEAGVDPFDPDEVPPATDTPPLDTNIRDTEQWEEERAEVKREEDHDELLIHPDRQQFPPTHYDEGQRQDAAPFPAASCPIFGLATKARGDAEDPEPRAVRRMSALPNQNDNIAICA